MRPTQTIPAALGAAALFALATAASAQGGGGDPQRGAQLFAGKCALCHSNGKAAEAGLGPPLWGVAGRKAAAVEGYAYSDALRRTGLTWDDAHLDRFLTLPQEAVPGTKMIAMEGDPAARRDLIAYLHTLHDPDSRSASKPGAKSDSPDSPDSHSPPTSAAGGRPKPDSPDSPDSSKRAAMYGDWRDDAPGKRHRISVADLPPPYASRSSGNPPRDAARPEGALPRAPAGVKVALFASGLQNPRRMITAPNGDILLVESEAGRVRVLRPSRDDARPESSTAFAEGLSGPFGMAFYPRGSDPQWLYVAEQNRVLRFPYRNGDRQARGKPEVIVAQLAPSTGGHSTRDLAFSPDGRRLFVSVGSQSNVAQQIDKKSVAEAQAFERAHGATGAAWGAEENRADVLVTTPEGGPLKLFATGIRNCVGLTVQPATGALWCAVNERDGLGDDLVPDYVTRVREGGYYGWPWFYIGAHAEPRLAGARPDLAGKAVVPDVLIQPHSAALQVAFYEGRMFPEWRGSGLVTLHGSWNRSKRTGYKLVRVLTDRSGAPTGEYEDLLTGFVAGDAGAWGRPVGVTVAKDGSVLVSDDTGGVIWRVWR